MVWARSFDHEIPDRAKAKRMIAVDRAPAHVRRGDRKVASFLMLCHRRGCLRHIHAATGDDEWRMHLD
jgi:hypothetical protein